MDRSDLTRLLETHVVPLRLFLRGLLKNQTLVEDVLQKVSLKVLTTGSQARPETFRGWLFRVAWNEVQLLHRKQTLEHRHHQSWALRQSVAADQSPPLEQLLRQERHAQVRRSLDTLPSEQRQVLWLRIHDDKTFAEIAAELQLPLGTVVSRMQAGLKKLRRLLNEQAGDH